MDEDRRQLRERLRRELRLSPSEMESIWLKLEEMDVIGDFFEGLYQFEDLVDDAKETEEYLRTGAASRSKRGRPLQEIKEYFEVKLDHKNEQRAVALSEALACRADRHGEVIEFRENVLGGRLLAPERARDFLESPAVRHFMLVWFRNWGIPLLSHEAAVVLTDEDVEGFRWGPGVFETGFRPWIDRFVSVSVNPPGVTKNVLYGSHDIREPEGVRVDKRYFFRRSEEEDKHMRELPEVVVRYPWGGRIREITGLPGSVLDDVRSLGDLLATLYRWKQEEAVWFLLTGTTPLINPLDISASLLTGSYRSPPVWTVTLEVAPWMAVSTVSEAYREIQKQILKGDSSTSGIKQERKLAVFRFVTEQTRAQGERPPWQELFERWNEEYPEDHEWHYKKVRYPKSRYESFQRDYRDAEKAVMRPHYDFPKRKVTTKLEEWQEEDLSRRRAAAEEDLDRIAGYLEGEEPDY